MKKYLVLLCSMLIVLGAFTFASADDAGMDSARAMAPGAKVIIGGDAYVRGIWQQNFDTVADDDDDARFFDERVRLKVNAEVGDGIEARARVVLFGNADGDEATLDGGETLRHEYTVDYAYLHVPVGSVTIDTGLYKRNFGNRLNIWDSRVTTLQVSANVNNIDLAAYLDKVDETSAELTGSDNLDDYDAYGFVVSTSINDIKLGALLHLQQDNRPDSYRVGAVDPSDDSGYIIGVYADAKVSNIDLKGEFAYEGGDLNEGPDGDAGMGLFVSGSMPMNQITVGATAVYAASGFAADDHFNPTLLIGTDQVTAIMDFGANDDETSYGIAVSADYAVNDDLSVGGKLAYYAFPDQAWDGDDATLTEVDLSATYKLGANAQYTVDFAYGSVDGFTDEDDAPMVLANAIEVWF